MQKATMYWSQQYILEWSDTRESSDPGGSNKLETRRIKARKHQKQQHTEGGGGSRVVIHWKQQNRAPEATTPTAPTLGATGTEPKNSGGIYFRGRKNRFMKSRKITVKSPTLETMIMKSPFLKVNTLETPDLEQQEKKKENFWRQQYWRATL